MSRDLRSCLSQGVRARPGLKHVLLRRGRETHAAGPLCGASYEGSYEGAYEPPRDAANFGALVLGCIELVDFNVHQILKWSLAGVRMEVGCARMWFSAFRPSARVTRLGGSESSDARRASCFATRNPNAAFSTDALSR